MKRIDTPTAQPNLHGSGKPGFRDGHGFPDNEPTEVDAAIMNALQEEIARTVELSGYALDAADNTQLSRAISARALLNALANTRIVVPQSADFTNAFDVAWGPVAGLNNMGLFAVVGRISANGAGTTGAGFTGEDWTVTQDDPDHWRGICFGDDIWVLVGEDSSTGAARIWTEGAGQHVLTPTVVAPPASTDAPLNKVCFNGTVCCAVGDYIDASTNSQILTATDPTGTWTKRTPGSSSTASFVCCATRTDTGRIVIGGSNGEVHYSSNNGASWTRVRTESGQTVTRIVHVGGDVWLGISLTDADDVCKLIRSTDNCATWSDIVLTGNVELGGSVPEVVARGLTMVGSAVVSIMHPDNATRLAHFCVSLDRGATWMSAGRMNTQDFFGDGQWSIASDGRQVVACALHGLVIATDAVAVAP